MATSTAVPLIAPLPACGTQFRIATKGRMVQAVLGATVFAVAFLTFWPTVDNGFLPFGFDDSIITDTAELRELSWANTWRIFTSFNQVNYVPLSLLTLAVDYHGWGLDPRGYHLTNVLLHALAALLAYVWLLGILPTWPAAAAAAVFAVHPLQMEAVSVAIQRKTVLSGVLFFATLIWYQQWCRRRERWLYVGAIITYAAAALAKPLVASLPLILVLYDYVFVTRRWHVRHLIPFGAIAAATCAAAAAAHAAIGATHGLHGGNLFVHLLIVSRAQLESATALLFPANLSPIYYYPIDAGYDAINFAALIFIPLVIIGVTLQRNRHPWPFFCVWWIVLICAPEANIFPIAQLRADRYMYLAVMAAGIGFAAALSWLTARERCATSRWAPTSAAAIVVALLATVSYRSAAVWHSDISAWTRVAERHPWSVTAHTMLGRAYLSYGNAQMAERLFVQSTHINPRIPDPYLYLTQLYLDYGHRDQASATLQRALELAPDDPEAKRLLALMQSTSLTTTGASPSFASKEMDHS